MQAADISYDKMRDLGYVMLSDCEYASGRRIADIDTVYGMNKGIDIIVSPANVIAPVLDNGNYCEIWARGKEGRAMHLEECLVSMSDNIIIPLDLNYKEDIEKMSIGRPGSDICACIPIDAEIRLMPFLDDEEEVRCEETGLYTYKSCAWYEILWSTPFSDPKVVYFINADAANGFKGEVYSKDFSYFMCDDCCRTICEQNPKNGWHVQFRYEHDEKICLSCYEERRFENGDNEQILKSENDAHESIPGMFYDTDELKEKGWKMKDAFFVRPDNAKWVMDKAREIIREGNLVIVNYFTLAITGSEGTIELWIKPMEDVCEKNSRN